MATPILHDINGNLVPQRIEDGYVNATKLCQAGGKLIADYLRLSATQEYLEELSSDMGIPISLLVQVRQGVKAGTKATEQGTWVHPDVAVDIAQWISPKFRVQVNRWVREWMTNQSKPAPDWQTNVQDYNRVLQREMKARISWRDGSKASNKEMCGTISRWSKEIKASDANAKVGQQIFAEVADEINYLITGEIARQMRDRLGVKKYELIRDFMPLEVLRHYWLATSYTSFLICKQQMHPVSAAFQATIWALPSGYAPTPIEFEIDIALVRQRVDEPGVEQLLLPWAIA